ncbi:hypothetical protein ASE69_07700 [Sphingomonas sp. Leaf208]|nr:hypothetical protein ASE69_07700 [Sphingomonas sp. Leaf208]
MRTSVVFCEQVLKIPDAFPPLHVHHARLSFRLELSKMVETIKHGGDVMLGAVAVPPRKPPKFTATSHGRIRRGSRNGVPVEHRSSGPPSPKFGQVSTRTYATHRAKQCCAVHPVGDQEFDDLSGVLRCLYTLHGINDVGDANFSRKLPSNREFQRIDLSEAFDGTNDSYMRRTAKKFVQRRVKTDLMGL